MTEKSSSIELNMNGNSITMEVKDVDHKEEFIAPLIEPTVNISKAVELSPTIIQRFSGILYALLATFLFTVSIFVTKQLKIELLHALLPRFLLQTILLIIYMKLIKHYSFYKQSEKQEIFFLLMNVFCAATGFLAFFLAYSYLPLPDLTTVRNTQVIWTAVLTAIIYRERPSIPVILATLLTMIGVICVAQPKFLFNKTYNMTTTNKISNDDYHQRLIGLSIVLYCSIVMSIMVISNKYLLTKYKTKQSLIQLQFTFVLSFIVIIHLFYKYYFLIDGIQSLKNDFLNWRYLCASSICLLQIISSILIQKAVKREHPSVFTITQSSDILFSIILQNVFTSIKSNILSLFGSILVLTSILIVSGFKLINDKKTKKSTTEMQSN